MTLYERYDAALDAQAAVLRDEAAVAKSQGDQRAQSIELMKASMLGDMLKTLGRVEHDRRPGLLESLAAQARGRAQALRSRDDFDAAEREDIKADTILWALETLRKLVNEK